jgi:hypothetical protein
MERQNNFKCYNRHANVGIKRYSAILLRIMPIHPNVTLIREFYTAFQQKNYSAMQAAYHAEAVFSDPVFQNLSSKEVKAMWQMLVTAGSDLKIEFRDAVANDQSGTCHWEAWYTFTATGKKVHNIIDATFEFKDGKIYRHEDHFDFWRWSKMALGTPGLLLGWSSYLLNKVRVKARHRLNSFYEQIVSVVN